MKRPLLLLIASLGLLCAPVVARMALGGAGSPVYSVPAIQAAVTRAPQAWLGRTLWVRGIAVVADCPVVTTYPST
jgi:hypothetical protein